MIDYGPSKLILIFVDHLKLEFKMIVSLGLQDISSKYITLETSYVFILYVYYLRIKLNGFCQRRPL